TTRVLLAPTACPYTTLFRSWPRGWECAARPRCSSTASSSRTPPSPTCAGPSRTRWPGEAAAPLPGVAGLDRGHAGQPLLQRGQALRALHAVLVPADPDVPAGADPRRRHLPPGRQGVRLLAAAVGAGDARVDVPRPRAERPRLRRHRRVLRPGPVRREVHQLARVHLDTRAGPDGLHGHHGAASGQPRACSSSVVTMPAAHMLHTQKPFTGR